MKKILLLLALFVLPVNAQVTKISNTDGITTSSVAANYVLKSGDTMTGPLTTTSMTVVNGMTVDTASNTLVVDSVNHRVGILTNSPSQPLHVIGNIRGQSTDNNSSLGLYNSTGNLRTLLYHNPGGALSQYNGSNVLTNLIRSDGNNYINGGNVGIGTTAPADKLHVVGGTIVSTAAVYGSGGATWEAGGGRGVYATNNSGTALSSGTVVQPFQSLTGLAVTTSAINSDYPVGTVYDDSCANGSLCRVCTEGICPARLITTGACAITNVYVKSGGEVGRAECATISAGTAHNDEIGQPATFSASNGAVIKIWAHRN